MNTKLDFNQWHAQILESIDAAPVKTESTAATTDATPTVDAAIDAAPSKTEIIQDVDTIMNSLAKLSVQIKEAVESIDVFENEEVETELNEEVAIFEIEAGEVAGKLADWMFYAPKYRNMQKKINKMKLNALDIQIAIDNLTDQNLDSDAKKAKKDALSSKKTTLNTQISDLQSAVDDKARERGEYIKKVLSAEKIKGQMALVQRSSGQEDDPAKKKSLADSMKELNQRYAEEQAAIKELTNKAKKNQPKKAQTPKKEEPKKEEPKEEPKKEEPKKEEPKEEPKKEEPKNKAAELEADIKKYNANIAHERTSIEKAKEELKDEKDSDKIAKLKDTIQKSKEDIKDMEDEIKNLKNEYKKTASAKESLIFTATELGLNEIASEISNKQDWQFENNSALYTKYKMEIEKQSAIKRINESHTGSSIADKFRMLLG